MFNVSTLLLVDALKPATPLIAPLVIGVAGLSSCQIFLGHPVYQYNIISAQLHLSRSRNCEHRISRLFNACMVVYCNH